MPGISVFHESERVFQPYLGDATRPDAGTARIARLVGRDISSSMSVGVVVYEGVTVDWNLDFDETIIILDGRMRIISDGVTYACRPGDVAWFPAHTPLTYVVEDRVTVFYAIHPMPDASTGQAQEP
jgi:ethanolamine utilization protein EutQ